MKKVLLLASLLMFSVFACNKQLKNNSFGMGKIMALRFETNPSTGFGWEFKFEGGGGEVAFDREENIQNKEEKLFGSAEEVIYYFKGVKAGNTNIRFTYRRPWKGGEVAYDVLYELSVDKDLNITCLSKMKGIVESNYDLTFFPNPTFLDN